MTKLIAFAGLAAATAALALGGCGGKGAEAPAALELTAADAGTPVRVAAGQPIEITLESNASTGYRWNLVAEPDPAVLKLSSSEYVQPTTADTVGSAGTEVWRFEAVSPGTTSLRLAYFRPFEPENVGREFQLDVTVR